MTRRSWGREVKAASTPPPPRVTNKSRDPCRPEVCRLRQAACGPWRIGEANVPGLDAVDVTMDSATTQHFTSLVIHYAAWRRRTGCATQLPAPEHQGRSRRTNSWHRSHVRAGQVRSGHQPCHAAVGQYS